MLRPHQRPDPPLHTGFKDRSFKNTHYFKLRCNEQLVFTCMFYKKYIVHMIYICLILFSVLNSFEQL